MSNSNSHFETSDLTLATFLYASGVILVDIDRTEPRRAIFIFEQPTKELISSYQSGTATINVLAFDNAQNELRARLFPRQRDGNHY